jgi:hypothetical protein
MLLLLRDTQHNSTHKHPHPYTSTNGDLSSIHLRTGRGGHHPWDRHSARGLVSAQGQLGSPSTWSSCTHRANQQRLPSQQFLHQYLFPGVVVRPHRPSRRPIKRAENVSVSSSSPECRGQAFYWAQTGRFCLPTRLRWRAALTTRHAPGRSRRGSPGSHT